MPLPTDAKERKATPIYSGVIKYFPLALAEVARVSKAGNDQHNPGQPLHWDKSKSTDHLDCIMRHIADAGTMDSDGQRHSAKVAWRALAALEMELESQHQTPEDEDVIWYDVKTGTTWPGKRGDRKPGGKVYTL